MLSIEHVKNVSHVKINISSSINTLKPGFALHTSSVKVLQNAGAACGDGTQIPCFLSIKGLECFKLSGSQQKTLDLYFKSDEYHWLNNLQYIGTSNPRQSFEVQDFFLWLQPAINYDANEERYCVHFFIPAL